MNLIKPCCCAAMVLSFSVACQAEVNANVVNKLIDKDEYAIAAVREPRGTDPIGKVGVVE